MIPVSHAAKLVNRDRTTLYRWIRAGLLSTHQSQFGPLLVDEQEVQRVAQNQRGKKP